MCHPQALLSGVGKLFLLENQHSYYFLECTKEEMYLYPLFHGKAIPVLRLPVKVCENRDGEYRGSAVLLVTTALWGK